MKYLENFKSEYIQSIYDFLEQDADVTNFKRDLIAVAEYKKIDLQDLEAEVFQYADLMNEDLKDKIVFIFREDGYLGMFGEGFVIKVPHSIEEYMKLKTGDIVSMNPHGGEIIMGTIFFEDPGIYSNESTWFCVVHNDRRYNGEQPKGSDEWKKYGECVTWLGSDKHISADLHIKKYAAGKKIMIPNLITDKKDIKELKDAMHFALVFILK